MMPAWHRHSVPRAFLLNGQYDADGVLTKCWQSVPALGSYWVELNLFIWGERVLLCSNDFITQKH